jgi:hypothetical protein
VRTYLTIPCQSDAGLLKTLMVEPLTGEVAKTVDYSQQPLQDALAPLQAAAQTAYGGSYQSISEVYKLIGVSATDELIFAIGLVQSGGALNFMQDLLLMAVSPAGVSRTIASSHVQMDAPSWMGGAPVLNFAAGGQEEAYFFGLDPAQADAPSGVIPFALYELKSSGYLKSTLTMPSGFAANSSGQFIRSDAGESMFVLDDNQTSTSTLYLIRKVGSTWTNKRNVQVPGVLIPLASVAALAAADGVGSLDYITGDADPTHSSSQGYDDLGNYRLITETLTSSGFSGTSDVRMIMDAALGENTQFAGPAAFASRIALPPPAFWANIVGAEVAA